MQSRVPTYVADNCCFYFIHEGNSSLFDCRGQQHTLLTVFSLLEMPVRRTADPISVQHVWDAIRFANCQRQMADIPRILKYLMKIDSCTAAQAELYVKQTLKDGLILYVS